MNHSNPDIGERILKKAEDIKVDKQKLSSVADEYGKKYRQEIIDGTKKRQLLLSEGAKRGLSSDDSLKEYGKFIPSVYTPIMNFLYFSFLESADEDREKYAQRDRIDEALIKAGQYSYDNEDEKEISNDEILDILNELSGDYIKKLAAETKPNRLREEINDGYKNEPKEELNMKEPEDMETFLFGNLTLEQFNTLKKLKALTFSNNVDEATLAFKKGKELAIKYKIDWDKVPCYYRKKE